MECDVIGLMEARDLIKTKLNDDAAMLGVITPAVTDAQARPEILHRNRPVSEPARLL